MKREIKKITDKIVQITTIDERYYTKDITAKEPVYYPSVTWICSYLPQGKQLTKWIADVGWDRSQEIMIQAGIKGSKVHQAIDDLLKGITIKMDTKFTNNQTGQEESLTADEWNCIMNFVDWYIETKPKTIAHEITVFNDDMKYAGTVDYVCEIDGNVWIIDWKTSKEIQLSHEVQLSAYSHANLDVSILSIEEWKNSKLGILQVGKKTKKGWKFTEIQDKFHLFKGAYDNWNNAVKDKEPKQRDFPLELSLKKEACNTTKKQK